MSIEQKFFYYHNHNDNDNDNDRRKSFRTGVIWPDLLTPESKRATTQF